MHRFFLCVLLKRPQDYLDLQVWKHLYTQRVMQKKQG